MKSPSEGIRRMPRSGIREVFDLAHGRPDVIHLEVGEPDFETPAHARLAAAEAAERGFTKYTPNAGILELRQALADKIRVRNGHAVPAEQVVVTPGAIAAIFTTFMALCDPGDEVLVSDPAWPNYMMVADALGFRMCRFSLRPERGMQPDVGEVERLVTARTKAILLNSPGNPTGSVLSRETLRALLDLADAHDLWVVSDEVYDEITFDGPAPSAATLRTDDRVVSVYSFSKTYAMTGWRVGYAALPELLAPSVIKAQEAVTACVNAPAQMAALAAVTGPQGCVEEMRDAYRERRDRALGILQKAGVPAVRPRGAFYLWVDVSASGLDGGRFARRLLTERDVAVVPGAAFGPASGDFVRASLATTPSALLEGVTRLVDAVHAWAP